MFNGFENSSDESTRMKIRGTVVLLKKSLLDVKDLRASILDRLYEFFGKRVWLQLISADVIDQGNGLRGKLSKASYLENWITRITSISPAAGEATFGVTFEWDRGMGVPGGFIVKNQHYKQIYIKSLTLEDVPDQGRLHFVCDSWVYPVHRYNYDRVFFSNKSYLPSETPVGLRQYREEELENLRGNGSEGILMEWDRVYDYAYYNDLGQPDKSPKLARPILGGSNTHPYPRRGKTGRPPTQTDPNTESRLPIHNINIYVPRDERFDGVKLSDFIGYGLKSICQVLILEFRSICDKTPNEFDTFQDVIDLYERGIKLPTGLLGKINNFVPFQLARELIRTDGERFLRLPLPDVIKEDKSAWRTDEEFGREMLAGVNPVLIQRLREFPPVSQLDRRVYGNHGSSITEEHIEHNMNGLTVDEAIRNNKLFILDHHDSLFPYLGRINEHTSTKMYATRTLLLLKEDGTLKPLAIELSLPHPQGDKHGATNRVYTPSDEGIEGSVWQLAKAYAAVTDSGYHQLISHWLNTHASIEPVIISANRQLSVIHPIYKLLHPHFSDTMHINALARHILINAGGILEVTVYPAKFAMELSSVAYKNWVFTDHALPTDLLKRGVAVRDSNCRHGIRLLIEDYPYAVDGLEIWSAIETWVRDYCSFYYPTNDLIQRDPELQSWWTELREVGHGDKKHEPWWPKMQTQAELIHTCAIIIWVASALHAAVNFGQYAYAGYLPNRPTLSRRFMPEPGTPEYLEIEKDPDAAFLKTITSQVQTLLGVSLIEILSRHSVREVYLGQCDIAEWTSDTEILDAFDRFAVTLVEIEEKIIERNNDERLKNRVGLVNIPYTLLYPNTSDYSKTSGLTSKGIPNSISM